MVRGRKKLKIQVLYGGNSSERPGSIISSRTLTDALVNAGYEHISRVDITKDTISKLIKNRPDLAFLTFHGGFGEDGSLQGLLEILEVPYTSSGVAASKISMDKVLFNRFVASLGLRVPNQFVARTMQDLKGVDRKYPIIIKPAEQGCSYGVFLVHNEYELMKRARFAFKFDGRVLVEDYIPGRELSVGIVMDPKRAEPLILPLAETKLVREICDYETKYPGGEHLSQIVIPAELPQEKTGEVAEMCSRVFTELGCKGYVRMDLRLDKSGGIYFLENNTIPGILNPEESCIPLMLRARGITLEKFVDMVVESTLKLTRLNTKTPSEAEMVRYLGLKLAGD